MLKKIIFLLVSVQMLFPDCYASDLVSRIRSIDDGKALAELMNQLLYEYESRYTVDSPEYAGCLMWCADVCVENRDNRQGKRLMQQSEDIFRKYGNGAFNGRDTLSQIFFLDLNAKLEENASRTYMTAKYMRDAALLKEKFFGRDSEIYLTSLLDISRVYAERLQYDRSNHYHNIGYHAYVDRIKSEFCSTCESKRSTYWSTAARYINRTLDLAFRTNGTRSSGDDSSLASAAYNAILLSKGLLLNTTLGFDDYINASGNREAIRILKERKTLVDRGSEQSLVDSLDYEIIRVLKEAGQEFNLPHLYIGWKDVAAKLGKDDLAVEFYKTVNGVYGAILLKKGWRSPMLVRLKDVVKVGNERVSLERALKQLSLESYTATQADDLWSLSKAIWTDDIVRYFPVSEGGRVYFSADGELLTYAIEYLPHLKPEVDGHYYSVSDLFKVYRLSSTRQLVLKSTPNNNSSAAVYGGLTYDFRYDEQTASIGTETDKSQDVVVPLSDDTLRAKRAASGFEYLTGTRMEADRIVSTIRKSNNQNLDVKPYIGADGTETSFKALSGAGMRLLHIATHGYFYSDDDGMLDILQFSDHPLNRSGLVFSGAENKLFYDFKQDVGDDGFLTALEISALDFRNLELVVLSACETGRGSIEADGVFGLQRGFKMAGVNSILMSLWKVDDEATCALMIEFYKNWILEGKNKHDALELAKNTIRANKDKKWDNPEFWAAFILLDAVE